MIDEDFKKTGKTKYALIFMDCNMPGMDGFETTTNIREYLYQAGAE